jgi:hypothetical protein
MDIHGPAARQQFIQKIRLRQRFASAKGNAAAGLVKKDDVLDNFFHHLVNGYGFANKLHSSGRAIDNTSAATGTFFPGYNYFFVLNFEGLLGADQNTPAALNTPAGPMHKLRFEGNSLRIMAPQAMQRAALEKNGGANAGPIVYGIPLDIEDDACCICHIR